MTESLAERIIDYRKDTPFETGTEINSVLGESWSISAGLIMKSLNFRVITRASVNDITRIIESIIDTKSKIYYWREV